MEKKFTPKPGQVDYTNIRRAPVINCVLRYGDKILLVKRSAELRLYPNYWNGISGFLDDDRSVLEKVKDEIREETGIGEQDIISIKEGEILELEEPEYEKTWIVHPVLVDVKTDDVKLDWESQEYEWVNLAQLKDFELIPGFERVIKALFE